MEPINSPYYLGNREMKPVIIEAKNSHVCISQELPWDANGEDLMNAFYTMGVGLGFDSESLLYEMKTFAEEHTTNDCVIDDEK